MPDFKNGKIYTLWCHETDEIYVGSTTQTLSQRLSGHKKLNCSSKILLKKSDNVMIELIENYPCENKMELNKKEGEYIRKLDCINKQVAGRTEKEYYENHKEFIKEYHKKNYEKNKESYKEYRENNKETKKEYQKEYQQKNKEIINEKRKKKITCELCNCEVRKDSLIKHTKSLRHQGASATVAGSAVTVSGSTTGSTGSISSV